MPDIMILHWRVFSLNYIHQRSFQKGYNITSILALGALIIDTKNDYYTSDSRGM